MKSWWSRPCWWRMTKFYYRRGCHIAALQCGHCATSLANLHFCARCQVLSARCLGQVPGARCARTSWRGHETWSCTQWWWASSTLWSVYFHKIRVPNYFRVIISTQKEIWRSHRTYILSAIKEAPQCTVELWWSDNFGSQPNYSTLNLRCWLTCESWNHCHRHAWDQDDRQGGHLLAQIVMDNVRLHSTERERPCCLSATATQKQLCNCHCQLQQLLSIRYISMLILQKKCKQLWQ